MRFDPRAVPVRPHRGGPASAYGTQLIGQGFDNKGFQQRVGEISSVSVKSADESADESAERVSRTSQQNESKALLEEVRCPRVVAVPVDRAVARSLVHADRFCQRGVGVEPDGVVPELAGLVLQVAQQP
jgi:hypothetical protein